MFNWLRELLEIRHEFREKKYKLIRESNEVKCESCESLKVALERANYEKDQLLNRILNPIKEVETRPQFSESKLAVPRQVPWHIRKQMLEAEDREQARILKNMPKPKVDYPTSPGNESIEDLEKELEDAGSKRESQTGIQ